MELRITNSLENPKPIQFQGLNRTLSKKFLPEMAEVKDVLAKNPNSKGIIGNLPFEWVQRISKKNREIKIKTLYSDFKEIVDEIKNTDNLKLIEKKLNIALKKAGIIKNKQKCDIKYVNRGSYGSGYMIKTGADEKYLFKVFHFKRANISAHGIFGELNAAAFWKKAAGNDTQRVKFYFGDMESGYMVNQFISNETPVAKKNVPEILMGIYDTDTSAHNYCHNLINNFKIDYGGLYSKKYLSELNHNKTARYVFKQLNKLSIADKLKSFDKFIETCKNKEINPDIKIGYINALSLLDPYSIPKYFQKLMDSADEKSTPVMAKFIMTYSPNLEDTLLNIDEKTRFTLVDKILKNADKKTRAVIAENISCIDSKYRNNILEKLFNDKDLEVQKGLAKNLVFIETPDRIRIFKELLKQNKADTNQILALKINSIPFEVRSHYFNKLFKQGNLETKKNLVKSIPQLEPEEKLKQICKFLKLKNIEINDEISYILYSLPDENGQQIFKKLLKINDSETNARLIDYAYILESKDRLKIYNTLSNSTNLHVKIELAKALKEVKLEERFKLFKKLAKSEDLGVNMALTESINSFYMKEQQEAFLLLLSKKRPEINEALSKQIINLPISKRYEVFNLLLKNATPQTKKNLSKFLYGLPDNKIHRGFMKLAKSIEPEIAYTLYEMTTCLPQNKKNAAYKFLKEELSRKIEKRNLKTKGK